MRWFKIVRLLSLDFRRDKHSIAARRRPARCAPLQSAGPDWLDSAAYPARNAASGSLALSAEVWTCALDGCIVSIANKTAEHIDLSPSKHMQTVPQGGSLFKGSLNRLELGLSIGLKLLGHLEFMRRLPGLPERAIGLA